MNAKYRKSMPISSSHLSAKLKLSLEVDDDDDGVYIGEESSNLESDEFDEVMPMASPKKAAADQARPTLSDQDKRLSTNSIATSKRGFKRAKTKLSTKDTPSLLKKAHTNAGKRTPTQTDDDSLSMGSQRAEPYDKMIREYKPPNISTLSKFFDCYQLIYNYSKSKINRELQMILHYL